MDYKTRAEELMQDWQAVQNVKIKHDAVDLRLQKDRCDEWAAQLMTTKIWGTELELAEACNQLEYRLKDLQKKIVIEVLKNGPI